MVPNIPPPLARELGFGVSPGGKVTRNIQPVPEGTLGGVPLMRPNIDEADERDKYEKQTGRRQLSFPPGYVFEEISDPKYNDHGYDVAICHFLWWKYLNGLEWFRDCLKRRQATYEQETAEERQQKRAREEWEKSIFEAKRKGPQYAQLSETHWIVERRTNQMTDQAEILVRSDQRNEGGAVGHVLGHCVEGPKFVFDVKITDEEGKPEIQLPQIQHQLRTDDPQNIRSVTSMQALLRQNERPPHKQLLYLPQGFENEFRMWTLSSPRSPELLETSWRLLTQIITDRGDLVIKIPIYDPSVQEAIRACVPDRVDLLDGP